MLGVRRVLAAGLFVLGALGLLSAAPRFRPVADPAKIARLLAQGPHEGECERCHTAHAEGQPAPQPKALIGPNDNQLCDRCHTTAWAGGSYAGTWLYAGSAHGSSRVMVWPGPDPPARIEADAAGKCVNCHDPHGREDAGGRIPRLANAREEKLCLTCHDGHPAATDIRADLQKPFRHPASDYAGRHEGPGESLPEQFGVTPLVRRHAECEDCHDPHVLRQDPALGPSGIAASTTTLGVSRVAVLNGPAGSPPAYAFLAGRDTLTPPVAEYQLCFKCHSSWTTQPAGQTDLARVLNPANPSYHPVEATGRNPGVSAAAFVPGWSASSLTRCGDCHGSDFGTTRGPHGSIHRHILRRPYVDSPAAREMTQDELCFACHSHDVYANPLAPELVLAASRFNPPATSRGHAGHVGTDRVPCYACHVSHGSTVQPHLIATGRNPGIVSYMQTPMGGTCAPSCHGSRPYTVNYAR